MRPFIKRNFLWGVYALFLVLAVLYGSEPRAFSLDGAYPAGKVIVWFAIAGFLLYSILCSMRANFFKAVRQVNAMWWGLQIGLDLYISMFLSLAVIYLNEGSLLVLGLWLVPVLFFANLAILPYIALNYFSLVERFTG